MKIITNKNYHSALNVAGIERVYNAKYLGDFTYIGLDGLVGNIVVPIFYVEKPDKSKGHGHYFGLNIDYASFTGEVAGVSIFNGESTIKGRNGKGFVGLRLESGEVLVSTHRNMMVCKDGICIDGGSDYAKITTKPEKPVDLVNLEIVDGEWKIK